MGRKETRLLCHMGIFIICLGYGSSEDLDTGQAISSLRQARGGRYRPVIDNRGDENEHYQDHDDTENGDMKAIGQPKLDYWNGYYDFLINEGSYKFWAVFQLATAALLIYSGFAALYYAKVNPPASDDDFDDLFRRRRRRRRRRSNTPFIIDKPYSGLDSVTFQRIIDAIERDPR